MVPAAFGILGAAVGDEVADVTRFAAAELADERAVWVSFEGFVPGSVRILRATVGNEVAEIRFLLSAMDANERSVLVAREKNVLPVRNEIAGAAVRQQVPRVGKTLSAKFAVFAHWCVSLVCWGYGLTGMRCLVSEAKAAATAASAQRSFVEKGGLTSSS